MAILRTVATLAAATTTTAVAAVAFSSSAFSSKSHQPKSQYLSFFSSQSLSLVSSNKSPLVKNFTNPPSALPMDAPTSDHKQTSQGDQGLPELLTEYMVDMKCEGCVDAVKNKLQTVIGVKNVEVDLSNQVVRILGSSPVKTMTEALEQTGRKARLVGQGVPEGIELISVRGSGWTSFAHEIARGRVSAAVAEFKGPDVFGVVRLAQVNMELARIEANFSGLSPGKHGWSVNEFGDLTKGAASTGKVYNPKIEGSAREPLGDLGTLVADEKGEAFFSGFKEMLRVADLIGRSIVVYGTEDKSDSGIIAAVIARSAGVGENYKKICTCDGTIIWESSSSDFVTS